MKNSQIALIFIFFFLLSIQANTQTKVSKEFQKAYNEGFRNVDGTAGESYFTNHSDYEIEVNFDPNTAFLQGKENIIYHNNSADTLKVLVFKVVQNVFKKGNKRDFTIHKDDIHEGVSILNLTINKQKYSEKDYSSQNVMTIKLKKPILPHSQANISLEWSFVYPQNTTIRAGKYDENSFFVGYWYPQIAVYDDVFGWDRIPHTGWQEFYNEHSNYKVSITVPSPNVVWATGRIQNPNEVFQKEIAARYNQALHSDEVVHIIKKEDENILLNADKNTFIFNAEKVPDFSFSTSDFYLWDALRLKQEKGQDVLVAAAYPTREGQFDDMASLTAEIIDYFATEIPAIPFPYPSMTIFNGGGAMEYPMMVNDMTVSENMVVSLTAHEIFHSYFPFYVGINETSYAWMDEGWATFGDYLIASKLEPANNNSLFFLDSYLREIANGFDIPIIANSHMINTPAYYYSSYAKASVFNLILKDLLGDELFYRSLREYIYRWNGKHPVPNDFFYSFNEISGQNLNWLFQPWFFDFGYPDLAIKEVIQSQDRYKIVVQNLGHYPIPVHLTILFTDGSVEEYHETAVVWKNRVDKIQINIPAKKLIRRIDLGTATIPDADPTNNVFRP